MRLPLLGVLGVLVPGVPLSLQSPHTEVTQPPAQPGEGLGRQGQSESGQQDELHHHHGGQAHDQQGRHQAAAQQTEDQVGGPGHVPAVSGGGDGGGREEREESQTGELLQAAGPHLLHPLAGLQAHPPGRGDDQAEVLGQHRPVRPLQVHPGVQTLHSGRRQADSTSVLSSVRYQLVGPL